MAFFNPCDKEGVVSKVVMSKADFEGFLAFLIDDELKDLRQKAYENIGRENGDAVASIANKIVFVRRVVADFITADMTKSNIYAINCHMGEQSMDEVMPEIESTSDMLSDLMKSVQEEVFDSLLSTAKMNGEAIAKLKNLFRDKDAKVDDFVTLVKQEGEREALDAFSSWRETPEGRASLKRAKGSDDGVVSTGVFDSRFGIYAPLLHFLEESLHPSQKAEFFTRLEDYVRSGWFAKDFLSDPQDMEDPMAKTVSKARELFSVVDLAASAKVTDSKLSKGSTERLVKFKKSFFDLIEARMSVLEVVGDKVTLLAKKGKEMSKIAGSGVVDSAFISADKKALAVSFATSNEWCEQGIQWRRHLNAVLKWVPAEAANNQPLGVQARVVAPCLITGARANEGKGARGVKAGSEIEALFGKANLSGPTMDSINSMPFLSELLRTSHVGVENGGAVPAWMAASMIRLDLVGASSEYWEKKRARIDSKAAFCECLSEVCADIALGVMETGGPKREQMKMQVDQAGGMPMRTIEFFQYAIKNIRHASGTGAAMEKLTAALPFLEAVRDNWVSVSEEEQADFKERFIAPLEAFQKKKLNNGKKTGNRKGS